MIKKSRCKRKRPSINEKVICLEHAFVFAIAANAKAVTPHLLTATPSERNGSRDIDDFVGQRAKQNVISLPSSFPRATIPSCNAKCDFILSMALRALYPVRPDFQLLVRMLTCHLSPARHGNKRHRRNGNRSSSVPHDLVRHAQPLRQRTRRRRRRKLDLPAFRFSDAILNVRWIIFAAIGWYKFLQSAKTASAWAAPRAVHRSRNSGRTNFIRPCSFSISTVLSSKRRSPDRSNSVYQRNRSSELCVVVK